MLEQQQKLAQRQEAERSAVRELDPSSEEAIANSSDMQLVFFGTSAQRPTKARCAADVCLCEIPEKQGLCSVLSSAHLLMSLDSMQSPEPDARQMCFEVSKKTEGHTLLSAHLHLLISLDSMQPLASRQAWG